MNMLNMLNIPGRRYIMIYLVVFKINSPLHSHPGSALRCLLLFINKFRHLSPCGRPPGGMWDVAGMLTIARSQTFVW